MFGWLRRKQGEQLSSAEAEPTSPRMFLDGAYRLHRTEDIEKFTALAVDAFPDFSKRITCFASDWSGCQFATDEARLVNGERQILLLEPGTGEVLQIPAGLDTFHSGILVSESEAVVGLSFFKKWIATGGVIPAYDQCIGYKKPLFLGGEDEVTNLEITDFEVYWALTAQILEQVRGLPIGTKIGSVSTAE